MRRPRWRKVAAVVPFAVAFIGGYLADKASGRPAIVGAIAVATFGATSAVLYVAVLLHAFRRPGGHEQHWTPQVFQADPSYEGAEFDLWSNCDHELAGLRIDVVEPGGRRVLGPMLKLAHHSIVRGSYVGGVSYPAHFPDASQVRFGTQYEVVWLADPTGNAGYVEIARQKFALPIEGGRLVGPGVFRPPSPSG